MAVQFEFPLLFPNAELFREKIMAQFDMDVAWAKKWMIKNRAVNKLAATNLAFDGADAVSD